MASFQSREKGESSQKKLKGRTSSTIVQELVDLVEKALIEVCPEALDLLPTKSGIKKSLKLKTSSDYSTSICRCAYSRLKGQQQQNGVSNEPVKISVTSSLGVERVRYYNSPEELAEEFIKVLSEVENDSTDKLVADVRIDPGGVVNICTLTHMEWQHVRGHLFCIDCGAFFNGERGLRDHQLVKHGNSYEVALQAVAADKAQLIKYTSDGTSIQEWERAFGVEKRARDSLGDEGLEAARRGDLELIRSMVTSGWNPHKACDKHGSGPLHWAAGEGHLEMCQYLVNECGVSAGGITGPHRKRRRSALHWAARNGKLDVVRWLVLEMNIPVDIGTSDGTTPFMYAVWQGKLEVCNWLITLKNEGGGGCNIAATNDFGCNAIQWCVQTGDIPMCVWLKDHNLDIGLCNRNGHSALHKAAVKGQLEVCRWLLSEGGLGLSQMRADSDGNDPAEMARLDGHSTLATYLTQEKSRLLAAARVPT